MDVDVLAMAGVGNGVLLEAEGGDSEAVDNVLRVEAKVNLATRRENELGGDEVVGGA